MVWRETKRNHPTQQDRYHLFWVTGRLVNHLAFCTRWRWVWSLQVIDRRTSEFKTLFSRVWIFFWLKFKFCLYSGECLIKNIFLFCNRLQGIQTNTILKTNITSFFKQNNSIFQSCKSFHSTPYHTPPYFLNQTCPTKNRLYQHNLTNNNNPCHHPKE